MNERSAAQTVPGAVESKSAARSSASGRQSEQYSLAKIPGIWSSVGRRGRLDGPVALTRALPVSLTGGLIWQFVLVRREQRSLAAGTFLTRDPVLIIDQTRSAP